MKLNVLKIKKVTTEETNEIFPVLLQQENRSYLVDCGYEETAGALESELESCGVVLENLTGIIITHDDYDHLGGLKRLKQVNEQLKIYCGEQEADSVSGLVKSERLIQAETSLESVPPEFRDWAENFIHQLKKVQRFGVDKGFTDQDIFEHEILVVHTPGHTKGHISLFLINEMTLIAGDALVIEDRRFNIANPDFTLDLETAVKSVEKIRKLNPRKIICYHGGIMDENVDAELEALIIRYGNQL
jgi:glyoxylase-like metal-dependent hydrolase (beta-lactamase superfamily II)